MRVSYIAPAIMYVTIEPNLQECWVLLHWISGYVCSSYIWPVCMSVLLSTNKLPRHQQTYLPLRMFDYVPQDQHTCLKPSDYVSNSFTRLAGMLQYPCFKHCFEPTGMFVAVAPDHLARRLQLNSTSMHVCRVACLNQLQLTYTHICSCVAELEGIYVTLVSDPKLCPNARTQLRGWKAQLHQTIMHVFYSCT